MSICWQRGSEIVQGHGARSQFIAMYHVMVAQQSFYVICPVQFLASGELGAADMARAWHRDEWFTQGDAWYFFARAPHSKGQESYPACWSAAVCTCADALQQFTQTLCRSAVPLRVRLSRLCSIALTCSERFSAERIRFLFFQCGRCLHSSAASRRSKSFVDC